MESGHSRRYHLLSALIFLQAVFVTGRHNKRVWVTASVLVAPLLIVLTQVVWLDQARALNQLSAPLWGVCLTLILSSAALSSVALFIGNALSRLHSPRHPGAVHVGVASVLVAFIGGVFAFATGGGSGALLVMCVIALAGATWALPVAIALELTSQENDR